MKPLKGTWNDSYGRSPSGADRRGQTTEKSSHFTRLDYIIGWAGTAIMAYLLFNLHVL